MGEPQSRPIAERLERACIDWDHEPMLDGERPRVELLCRDYREAASHIRELEAMLAAAPEPPAAQAAADRALLEEAPLMGLRALLEEYTQHGGYADDHSGAVASFLARIAAAKKDCADG